MAALGESINVPDFFCDASRLSTNSMAVLPHVTPNEMEFIWVFALIWMLFWCQGIFILSRVLCSSHRHMAQIWRALFAYCSCRRPQAGGHGGRSFWLTQWRRGGRGGRVSRAPEGAAGSKMAARRAWGRAGGAAPVRVSRSNVVLTAALPSCFTRLS